jgi:inner membrane protein
MFIGHLPVGYLVSNLIHARLKSLGIGARGVLVSAMCGSIAPDLDLLYFYLIDHQQHNHRSYWTHYPSAWICLVWGSLIFCYVRRWRARAVLMVIFSLNGFIHIVLDGITGPVYWLAPFSFNAYSLVTVPALYEPWWLNFFLHWTYLIEMVITVWAIFVWREVATYVNKPLRSFPE